MARRGAWIEYDAVGSDRFDDAWHVDHIGRVLDAGFGAQLLLSHDRGWYDPSKPGGGVPKPYTHLVDSLLPRLREAGIDESTIRQLTQENPFRAYAR
jgi:phosphotriesterase-related protein